MSITEFFNKPLIQNGLYFLLGGLVMKLIDIFVTKDINRQNRNIIAFEDAARKFISVVARELVAVSSKPDLSRLDNIEVAILEFKPHLCDEQKQQINETWEKYKTLENNRSIQKEFYNFTFGSSLNKQLLEDLLKFTEKHEKDS